MGLEFYILHKYVKLSGLAGLIFVIIIISIVRRLIDLYLLLIESKNIRSTLLFLPLFFCWCLWLSCFLLQL